MFPDLAQHNQRALLDAGLCATANSDDPAYFGGYITENFLQVFAATGLTAAHAWQLTANSVKASFAPECDKQAWRQWLSEVFEVFEHFAAPV